MRAVDTNVLVRLIARDEPRQITAAEAFVRPGAWASHVVLAELVWVLESVYHMDPTSIAHGIEMLLERSRSGQTGRRTGAVALARVRLHRRGMDRRVRLPPAA